ncbi:MAG: DNA mismatch repair protein MutS, partial [Ferruginibacter sp.]
MEIDNTTLHDLSVFNAEEDFSIINKLNFTNTIRGKEQLKKNFSTPLRNLAAINGVQQTIQLVQENIPQWPVQISNGTIMVLESFIETAVDAIPSQPNYLSTYSYKLLHGPDFSLVKYATGHCFDFIKGMQQIMAIFFTEVTPAPMRTLLQRAQVILEHASLNIIAKKKKSTDLNVGELLQLGHYIRFQLKSKILELVNIYAQMDAWYSMAMAKEHYGLSFPVFTK